MDNHERLTRDDLISRVREIRKRAGLDKRGQEVEFPFGEREQREFEASLWPIRIFDCETLQYLAVNDAALKLYGYTREEFLALTPLDTRHPGELDSAVDGLSKSRNYLRYLGMRRHVTKFGRVIVVEVVSQEILFNGRRACMSLTIDVTDRALLMERLHQSDQAFQAMVENAPDITARFDRDLRHTYVSAAITRVTGLAPSVFIGKTNQELGMPRSLTDQWDCSLKQVFESGCEQRMEFGYPAPIGMRYFDVRMVPEFGVDQNVKTVLSIARDITERKKSELAMQRTMALTNLLGSLARAANEAVTPEFAMSACLRLICEHGNWDLGRVIMFDADREEERPRRSIWCTQETQNFCEFIRVSSDRKATGQGDFVSRVLREQGPVWIENLQKTSKFNRRLIAASHGIRTGFAFPIVVHGRVVAVIELLSLRQTPQDPLMMDAAQTIAGQLSRLVERELAHQSNARLASIVESSQDAIVLRAVDGTVLTWNGGAERLFGYSSAEIVGRSFELLIPDELRQETASRRERANRGEVIEAFETVRVAKDGRRIDVSIVVSPVHGADSSNGTVVAISTVIRDISRQKHAERELQRQKKLLDAVVENLPVSVVVKDAKTFRFMMANRVAAQMSTMKMEQFIGKTAHDVYPGVQAEIYSGTDQQALQSRQMVEIAEQQVRGPAGDLRVRHTRKVPIFNENGEPWVLVGIGDDITERKIVEQEFKRQKQLLETIIEHLPVGITVKDADAKRYVLRNRLANELTGQKNAEILGKSADDIYPPELAALIAASDRRAMDSGGAVSASPLAVRAASGRTVRNLKVPVPDECGRYTHIVSILEDLTEIEEAQYAVRQSEQRMRELISMSPAAIFSFAPLPPFGTTFISENITGLTGWRPSDFTDSGSFWREHVHPDDRMIAEQAASTLAIHGSYTCEYRFRHRDGGWRWIRDEGRIVRDKYGNAKEAIGSWTDVTGEREESESRMQRALLQRDSLVREVHHRIKNNIQGVIGLLRRKINKRSSRVPELEEAVMQLQTIATAYGLEGKGSEKPLSLTAMLDSICNLAEKVADKHVVKAYQSVQREPLFIVAEEAVPFAVALNELVFNALKHHATSSSQERVLIALREHDDFAELRISNQGQLPPQFDFEEGSGLNEGLDLVKTLLIQSGGDLKFISSNGNVEVVLSLRPPLLAKRPKADTTSTTSRVEGTR